MKLEQILVFDTPRDAEIRESRTGKIQESIGLLSGLSRRFLIQGSRKISESQNSLTVGVVVIEG